MPFSGITGKKDVNSRKKKSKKKKVKKRHIQNAVGYYH